jgi:uncharacterized membrane protein
MTAAALVFMLFSVSSVVALVVWCYYRVLTTPPSPTAGSEHETS